MPGRSGARTTQGGVEVLRVARVTLFLVLGLGVKIVVDFFRGQIGSSLG